MTTLKPLLARNRSWALQCRQRDPNYFEKYVHQQQPHSLWIGCSDSRVPAEVLTGSHPGELFVHRNIANMVDSADDNFMSVLQYALYNLKVERVVLCGHYGCGGVKAAMQSEDLGILNPWLRNIRDVYRLHKNELDNIKDEEGRYNRLIELNVQEQCINVIKTAAVQEAKKAGKSVDDAAASIDLNSKYKDYQNQRYKAAVQAIYDEIGKLRLG